MQSGVQEFDLMFVRSAVSFIHSLIVVICLRIPIYGPELSENPHTRKMLLLRSIIGTIGFGTFVFAVARLPLGVINIIGSTKPFWSSILSFFVLGETVRGLEIGFMVCSFGGILLIAIASMQKDEDNTDGTSESRYLFGLLFVIIFSFAAATVGVLTRMMQKLHYGVVLVYYQALAIMVCAVIMLVQWAVTKEFKIFTYIAS